MTASDKPRILIVDDTPENLQVLYRALEDEYTVYAATNGRDALEIADSHRPDLILLDILMPEMNGIEVCKRLRSQQELCNTPIIFITALGSEQDELLGLELGAVDYIVKPVNVQMVRMRVRNQLELKKRGDALEEKTLQLEAALFNERKMAEEQCLFLRLISHELRTPLAIIDSAAQALPILLQDQPALINKAASIRSATKRLIDLMENCLADDRLELNALRHLQARPTDVRSLVRKVAEHVQSGTETHRILCSVEEMPENFVCDAMLVEVLIGNLLGNAVKYSPGGGDIVVNGRSGDGGVLLLDVTDSGVGITSEQMERIFDKFYRGGQVSGVAGAGLGLYLVRQIAELHGGAVNCVSEPNRGSTFSARLGVIK